MNATSAVHWGGKFENCTLALGGSNLANRFNFGANSTTGDDQSIELENVKFSFANVAHAIVVRCPIKWFGTASAISGTVPTTLFVNATGCSGWVELSGVDLSAASGNLVDMARQRGRDALK